MRVFGLPRVFYPIARHSPPQLSPQAQERRRWLSAWEALLKGGLTTGEASEVLGISRASLHRWRSRLKTQGPRGLEDRSRKPRNKRRPTWSLELVLATQSFPKGRMREQYPRWGKDKLVALPGRQGFRVSTSMVGRILTYLKARGEVLKEPPHSPNLNGQVERAHRTHIEEFYEVYGEEAEPAQPQPGTSALGTRL